MRNDLKLKACKEKNLWNVNHNDRLVSIEIAVEFLGVPLLYFQNGVVTDFILPKRYICGLASCMLKNRYRYLPYRIWIVPAKQCLFINVEISVGFGAWNALKTGGSPCRS